MSGFVINRFGEGDIMVEYIPWSKKVLESSITSQKNGRIPTLDLELTAKCSGACCIYCDSKPAVCYEGCDGELEYDVLEHVIRQLKLYGLKWVYTCGLGEPLEDTKFWELVHLLKNNGIKLSMFSNGIFIDSKEVAKELLDNDVNIILKMDTFVENDFDAILGHKGCAEKIYNARDLLLEAGYGAKGNEQSTNLAFSIVPTSLSIDNIKTVIDYADKHGIFASIGELEQAGEVINHKLNEVLGISRSQVIKLKEYADEYAHGDYMRPICPCILTGLHIDNLGNCLVDKHTGLNCKWFLLQNPETHVIGSIKETDIYELFEKVNNYRKERFIADKDSIMEMCNVSYVFGGCGGNPKDIISLVMKNYAE